MDINKLNNISNNFKKTEKTSEGKKSASSTSKQSSSGSAADKVSISNYKLRNNDQLYAKIELEKLNELASKQLGNIKTKITEYQEAKRRSPEAAEQTEIGQKLNDPDVWEDIANKILR